MRLYARHDYEADPAEVFTMLTDEAFLQEKLRARGDTEVRVLECGPGAGGFRIVTRRVVALDVPGFARRFLRPTNKVTQTDIWSDVDPAGTRTGTWQVEASGVPVTMAGTMALTGTSGHSVEEIDGDVRSTVPFVGGQLAAFVGRAAVDNLAAEHAFALRWLAARTPDPARHRASGRGRRQGPTTLPGRR